MKSRLITNSAWLWITPIAVLLTCSACDDDGDSSATSTSSSGTTSSGTGGTGGASSSGTGGTAGAGGSGQTLSCSEYCAAVFATGCANGPNSVEECESKCEPLVVMCPEETAVLADCLGSDVACTCDANGYVVLEDCQTEHNAAVACMAARVDQCNDSCQAVVDTGCANGPQDITGCEQGCLTSALTCTAELGAVLDCAGTSPTFDCDAGQYPFPNGCESEQQALTACLLAG